MNKKEQQNQPTEHFLPQWLIAHKITDPHLVLAGFFDYCSLPDCRAELKEWLYTALASGECTRPGDLVFFHECLVRLIEAAYMLMQDRDAETSSE